MMKRIAVCILGSFLMCFLMGCKASKQHKLVFDTVQNEIYIDSMFQNALHKGFFPGAQIMVGTNDSIFLSKNYGFHDYSKQQPVKSDDVYDLASISKVLGATLVTMRLAGENKIYLDDKLGEVVSFYKKTSLKDLTLFELLTHTSGLKPFITFYQNLLSTPDGLALLSAQQSDDYPNRFGDMYVHKDIIYDALFLSFEPRENFVQIYKNMWLDPEFYYKIYDDITLAQTRTRGRYVYSDLNLILAQQMLETKTGRKLDVLTREIYNAMDISQIGYNPLKWTSAEKVVPTEVDNFFRKDTLKGYVHDEAAAILGGVSGNAGLFANAGSIAVICQMLLNHGVHQDQQILKPEVIREFTESPLAEQGIYRGIGFDKRKRSTFYSENDFGHTGYTGTFFFMNPDTKMFLIILTNRVHPTRTNRLMYQDDFGPKIWQQINTLR